MIYLFGKMVTAEEKAFFSKVLANKPDRIAQGLYFKAVCNTARREGVSLMQAYDIVELKNEKVQHLNKMLNNEPIYFVNNKGKICKNIIDFFHNHVFKRKVSDTEIHQLENGVIVNPTKPKPKFFKEFKKDLKKTWGFIKEALMVY